MGQLRREVAVVGGGLAGYAAALDFAEAGFDTLLAAPPARSDGRSTALIGQSVSFLSKFGIFDELTGAFEQLSVMRLIDDTARLLRAPIVEFRAREIGLEAFGYNVLNGDMLAAMRQKAQALSDRLTFIEQPATRVEIDEDYVTLAFDSGDTARVQLCVGADGRDSLVRASAGIPLRAWSYPQSAIVLNFTHDRPHDRVSTEFHTPTGPFTQVPLPGRRSSLVWVENPSVASLAADLKPAKLSEMIEGKMHSLLGRIDVEGGAQTFPLRGASAMRLTGRRVALIGEAAHVSPPIGAQGFNLGLRDAAAIVRAANGSRDDPGRAEVLVRYEADRRADVVSRTLGVDWLNRSLLTAFLPVQFARSVGLNSLAMAPVLRRFVMREGVTPGAGFKGLPRSVLARLGIPAI